MSELFVTETIFRAVTLQSEDNSTIYIHLWCVQWHASYDALKILQNENALVNDLVLTLDTYEHGIMM